MESFPILESFKTHIAWTLVGKVKKEYIITIISYK